jgi:drug/metabolite transporter (DMT)-like permease
MGCKTHHFPADLILETGDDRNGHDHNGQSQADPENGNAENRPGDAFPVVFAEDEFSGYKDLGIHQKNELLYALKIIKKPLRSRVLSTTFLAIVACLLWSTAFVGVKIGLKYTTPLQFAGFRFFLSGLYILPFCGHIGRSLRQIGENWKEVLRLALFQTFLLYALFYLGISLVPAAITAIIIGASPLFSAILAHMFLTDDKMTLRKMASISLGMTGVVIIAVSRGSFSWVEGREFWGILILILANVAGSMGNVMVVKYRSGLPPILLNSAQLMSGGLGLILLSIPFEGLSFGINEAPYYISLGWLSFMSAAAFSIWFVLLRRPGIKVSELNVWKFLIPVFGAILSWTILADEKPEIIALTGMLMIGLSLIVLNANHKKNNNRQHNNKQHTHNASDEKQTD